MKNFAKNTLSFLLIFAVFCIASCSGLSDVEAPEIAADFGTTNISTGGGTNGNTTTVVPIVDGKLCVAIDLGLPANKTVARSAVPSGIDANFVFGAVVSASGSTKGLKAATYTAATATEPACVVVPFEISTTAREDYTLDIYAFENGTTINSSTDATSALLHGNTKISIPANSPVATLGDSVVKLLSNSTSATGTVELKITLPSADYTLSCSDTRFTATTSAGVATITATIASGSYPVTFKVLKGSDVVYTRNETINVFPAMKTDVWLSGDGASTPSSSLTITLTEINSTFYVAGSGSTWFIVFGSSAGDDTTGNGSLAKPYATIQKAIDKIKATNDGTTEYKIYVDGTFTGTTTISVTTATKISIEGLGTGSNIATLDGNKAGTVIIASGTNLNLTLKNLKITNGNGNYGGGINNTATLNITDCEISKNTATKNGGGIYNSSGTFTMSGGTISDNSATSFGGGIYNISGTLKLENGIISDNSAIYGGGVCVHNADTGTFTMSGGTIRDNSAKYGGGIINYKTFEMSGGTISGNTATNNGGGIYSSGTVTMQAGTITNNTATSCGGGIIIADGKATVSGGTIKDNVANNNLSDGSGGQGICVWNGTLELKDGAKIDSNNNIRLYPETGAEQHLKITGNLTETGTVATIWPKSYTVGDVVLEADDAAFITSSVGKFVLANSNYAIAQDETTTTNAVVVDNTPRTPVYLDASGGSDLNNGSTKALAVKTLKRATGLLQDAAGAKIVIVSPYSLASGESLDFSARTNTPTLERYYSSDADYFSGNMVEISVGTVTLKNVTLDGNWKASDGTTVRIADAVGPLILVSSSANVTLDENCTVKNNSMSGNGGGIFSNGILNLNGGTVSGNNAAGNGGGIYSKNKKVTLNSGTISNNTAKNGGGVFIYSSTGTFTMGDGTISGNTATENGGGVFIYDSTGTFTMSGGEISGNTATTSGGAVYNSGTFTMSGGTISGNTATNGGAVFNNATFTLSGGTIGDASATAVAEESACSNKATQNGGGIYNEGGTVTLSGGNISYNYASNGGGIFNKSTANSKLIMGSGCTATIKYNYCSTTGGGIYSGNTFTMQAGTISNNTANNGGGIAVCNGSTATIFGGTISNNVAFRDSYSGYGGQGICVWNGTLELEGGAEIHSSNNVRLFDAGGSTVQHLKITGTLTATGTVATIWPIVYTTDATVLEGDASLVSANYNKFALSNSSWHINSAGKLAK